MAESLIVHKPVHAISLGEARDLGVLVSTDSLNEVAGYANIERTVLLVRRDIDVIGPASRHVSIVQSSPRQHQDFRWDAPRPGAIHVCG